MATVLRLEGEAMRAREWGVASNTAAVDRAWWSVAAGHKLNFSKTLIMLKPSDPMGFVGGAFGGPGHKCRLVFL